MKSWALNGDLLEIMDGDSRIQASAEQIYSSVLEEASVLPGLPPGKYGAATTLSFSRYPVEMVAVLEADAISGSPSVCFLARTQHGNTFEISSGALEAGHVVHEGTWYPSAPGNAESVASILEEAGYQREAGTIGSLRTILHLKRVALHGGPIVDRLSDKALKNLLFDSAENPQPVGISATLYPYQIDGWRWLRFIIREQLGGLLADEMGLGKTLQVISALRDPGGDAAGRALVIAPGSLLENWIREIKKFCPDFRALKHHGGQRTGRPAELQCFDVVVASYDTAVRDLSLFRMVQWGVVVLDEAQNIKNPEALRTKSVKQIPRDVGLAVTGTPMENRLRDLWSIMDFVVPEYLGDLRSFEARYDEELDAAADLEPLVSPLMLRRRVADVANDLPERIDIPELLELTESEARSYDAIREAILEQYGKAATLVSIGKLRQFCAHPAITDDLGFDVDEGFSKFERLRELVEEICFRGEKALVFTSYTKMADLIERMAVQEFGVMAATLDGRLGIEERQPLIDRFSAHRGPACLILNPRAGGAGLNITAANHVIHYNPEWNPALVDQASARAYRRGQKQPVTIRRLIYAGTVEEIIDERLQRKRDIAETAVIGVAGRDEDYSDILRALQRSPIARRSGPR